MSSPSMAGCGVLILNGGWIQNDITSGKGMYHPA